MSRINLRPNHLVALTIVVITIQGLVWTYRTQAAIRLSNDSIVDEIAMVAPQYDLDPEFVYNIALAESNLNPVAQSKFARGIMQMSLPAWKTVTDEPYTKAWDWKSNVHNGIRYLSFCKQELENKGQFSYAKLSAAYRFGLKRLEQCAYDVKKLPRTQNRIYKKLLQEDSA
ncbi:MAG: hypothetical protein COX01_04085 [Verrucomicrobia bacterium CG22_combo_CG10-13_8_21_14_all_43_17]|nr:MAG: hypothetical protein COX01_04085 [Verrucomicrobia bacterium CG22_combo_CG10-13_8_21_14_all_43_17]